MNGRSWDHNGGVFLEKLIGLHGAIGGMVDQLQFHDLVTSWTSERIASKGLEKELSEGFARENPIAPGIDWHVMREDFGELCSDRFIADITVQAVIANSLKTLWENVLNHTTDKLKHRKVGMFDPFGMMVSIPIQHVFSVVLLNATHRDGRRDDVFGQVTGQSLSAWRDISLVNKGDKAIWIFGPCPIDVAVDTGIGDVLA